MGAFSGISSFLVGSFIALFILYFILAEWDTLTQWVAANLLIGGLDPVPMGNDNFTAAPSGVFRTGDGYINIAANKQDQWEAVCDALGVPELKTDERFEKRDVRKQNRRELTPLLEAKLKDRGTMEWVSLLDAIGVPE